MANTVVNTQIDVDLGDAPQTVGQMRQEFKDLTKSIGDTVQGTDEYYKKLKRLAELKGDLKDLKEDIRNLDPGDRFKLFQGTLNGIVGGFAAAQGAAALFGAESEDLQKILVRVNGALALLQGFQAFNDGVRQAKSLIGALMTVRNSAASAAVAVEGVAVATNTATKATTAWGTAIKATGIGLLLTLIPLVASATSSLSSTTDKMTESQNRLNISLEYYTEILNRDQSVTESEISLRRKQAEANGASAKELQKIDRELLESRLEVRKKILDQAKADEAAEQEELSRLIKNNASKKKIREQEDKLNGEFVKKRLEAEAAYTIADNALKEQQYDNLVKLNTKNKAAYDKASAEQVERNKRALELNKELRDENARYAAGQAAGSNENDQNLAKQLTELEQEFEKKRQILVAGNQSLVELEIAFRNRVSEITKAYDEKEIEDAKKKAEEDKEAREKAYINKVEQIRNQESQDMTELNNMRANDLVNQQYYDQESLNIKLASLQSQKDAAIAAGQDITDIDLQMSQIRMQQAEDEANAKIELAKREQDARLATINTISNALGAFSELVGKQTAVGKALAIAQTTIETYKSATQAYASLSSIPVVGPALGAIAAAAAVASGIANVKKILAVKIPGKGGAAGGSAGAAGSAASSYTAPSVSAAANVTNLSGSSLGSINGRTQTPVRAYVVESEITDVQGRVAGYDDQSSLGG